MINLQSGIKYKIMKCQKFLDEFASNKSILQAKAHSSMEHNFDPSSYVRCCVMSKEGSYLPTTCRHRKVQLHSFLTFTPHGGKLHHWWLYPRKKPPFPTKQEAGWAKSQSGHLDRRKISFPCQDLDAEWSSQQPSHYTNYATPTERRIVNYYMYFCCILLVFYIFYGHIRLKSHI